MNFSKELYGGILTGKNIDSKEFLYYLVQGLIFHRPDVSCEINKLLSYIFFRMTPLVLEIWSAHFFFNIGCKLDHTHLKI